MQPDSKNLAVNTKMMESAVEGPCLGFAGGIVAGNLLQINAVLAAKAVLAARAVSFVLPFFYTYTEGFGFAGGLDVVHGAFCF